MADTFTIPSRSASTLVIPRLSRPAGFWAVAFSFLVVTACSTAPSSLYGLYEDREHLSSLTITFVYAVYAAGVVTSLVLVGHVSDWYGRHVVLLPAIGIAIVAAVVLLVWRSVAGRFLARILTSFGVGAAVATATTFITDLDPGPGGGPTRRAGIVGTIANIGGLALGPLIAGLLAYEPQGLTLPLQVILALLVVGALAVARAPEARSPTHPRPACRPQAPVGSGECAPAVPGCHHRRVLVLFAAFGLFAGLAGAFLAGPLHHPSPALCGLTIFVTFGAGVIVETTTTSWPAHRLIAAGIMPALVGLGVTVASASTSPPSLVLFLIGGIIVGAGGGAMFRVTLRVVIATSDPDDRAGAWASFFTAGYVGLSVPVIGPGVALEHISPRVTVLIFGVVVHPSLSDHSTPNQPESSP